MQMSSGTPFPYQLRSKLRREKIQIRELINVGYQSKVKNQISVAAMRRRRGIEISISEHRSAENSAASPRTLPSQLFAKAHRYPRNVMPDLANLSRKMAVMLSSLGRTERGQDVARNRPGNPGHLATT